MSRTASGRLLVFYIHGLDHRRINEGDTPFLHKLLSRGDSVVVDTIPTNELVSTSFTGVWPHEHGLWQAAIRRDVKPGPGARIVDALPDWLTTSAQLVRYQFDRSFEMPAVPPRRRRRITFHRYKHYGLSEGAKQLHRVGGYETLFDRLAGRFRFRFADSLTGTYEALASSPTDGVDVDFIQTYGLDLLEHWGLDRPDLVTEAMRRLDGVLAETAERCANAGVAFLIYSDHGQEPVRGYVDLKGLLRHWGVSDDDCTYMIEAQCSRFWFHSEAVRRRVEPLLGEVEHTRLVSSAGLREFGLHFEDERFGELYLYTEQGHAFFPHDFYHPLANRVMGWKHREVMGPRLKDPRHRGYHGHLSRHPAEEGFMVMSEPGWRRVAKRAELIDVAPTVLSLVGATPAPTMTGRAMFERSD